MNDMECFHVCDLDSEESRQWIRERRLPTWTEPNGKNRWHYYVCCGQDNVVPQSHTPPTGGCGCTWAGCTG